jgi:predicted CopG family antitoxin
MMMRMAKNIAVADDVYKDLKRLKRRDESFSELLRRLIKTRGMISDLAGSATMSSEEWMRMKELKAEQAALDEEKSLSLLSQQTEG